MPNVDDRIVKIEFDNSNFERKIQETLGSLDKLNQSLKFEGAKKGLGELSGAIGGVNVGRIGSGIDATIRKFSTLGVVGFTAIQKITTSIFDLAKKAGGDILGPIISGGSTRAKNIEQAKFQFRGLGIDVDAAMASALSAVKGTAFGLDEAAKAAAQFGASGIGAGEQMTSSLRAISGAAALTGRSFTEIADIFTSSAGTGVVNTMDLQQFATRGLNAAAAVAKVLGKTEQQVRDMASNGKLDFKTFSDAMDKAFGQHAKDANQTFSGALANMRAAMSRLGASFIAPVHEQQRNIFNALTDDIDNFTAALQPVFNAVLGVSGLITGSFIKRLNTLNFTGIQSLAQAAPHFGAAIVHTFAAFVPVFNQVKAAFRDVFPKSSTSVLVSISIALEKFSKKLQASTGTLLKIREIFDGVFSALSIGWTILKDGVKFISGLVSALFGLEKTNALDFLVKLGLFFVRLQADLVTAGGIRRFFEELPGILQKPIPFLEHIRDAIKNLFSGFSTKAADGISTATGRVSDRFENLKHVFEVVGNALRPFLSLFKGIGEALKAVGEVVGKAIGKIGQSLQDAVKSGDFNSALDALNTALFGGIVLILHNFLKNGATLNLDFGKGLFKQITQTFNQLTGVLKAMQSDIKADAIKKIAEAIAILTASVLVLSLIDSKALSKSLTAMTVGFGQLLGAFAVLNQITSGPSNSIQFGLVATGMIALSTAILILSGAVAILGKLNFQDLAKGLAAVTILLAGVSGAAVALSDVSPTLPITGAGLILIAVALNILAGAVKIFSTIKGGDLAKGLAAIGAALLIIGIAAEAMPVSLPITAAGLVILSAGLLILKDAVKGFAAIPTGDIAKGLISITIGLALIAAAMTAMPPTLPITAAGLVITGVALNIVAEAVKSFGSMSWGEIAKGLVALAGSLVILAIGVTAMDAALPGAVALAIVGPALMAFVKVMETIGKLDWGTLIQDMLKIAAALGILALAALLLSPAIPAIAALGIALDIVGVALLLFGAGAFLAAKAYQTLADAAKNGTGNVVDALKSLGEAVPAFAAGLAQGFVVFFKVIADNAPQLIASFGIMLGQLLDLAVKMAPKFHDAFVALGTAGLTAFIELTPLIIQAGVNFLVTFLQGIQSRIGDITTAAVGIIVGFLLALADPNNMNQITGAGLMVLVAFINGIANNILLVIAAGTNLITQLIAGISTAVGQVVTAAADAIIHFIQGINDNLLRIVNAGVDTAIAFINGIGSAALKLANAGLDALVAFLNGLADAIDKHSQEIRDAGGRVAGAIIDGITGGLASKAGDIADKLKGIAGDAIHKTKSFLRVVGDPYSLVFMGIGESMMNGMAMALDADTSVSKSAVSVVDRATQAFSNSFSEMSSTLGQLEEFNPTITPVMDLTKAKAQASELSKLVNTVPFVPTISLDQANTIASSSTATSNSDSGNSPGGSSGVSFTQIINAPEQLSAKDIYKQTRNQITMAKEELQIP